MRYIDLKFIKRHACGEWCYMAETAMRDMRVDKIDLTDHAQVTEFLNRLVSCYDGVANDAANIILHFMANNAPSSAVGLYYSKVKDPPVISTQNIIRMLYKIETLRQCIVADHRKRERAKKAKAKTKAKR